MRYRVYSEACRLQIVSHLEAARALFSQRFCALLAGCLLLPLLGQPRPVHQRRREPHREARQALHVRPEQSQQPPVVEFASAGAESTCTGWRKPWVMGDVCGTEAGGRTRPKEIALTTDDRMRSSTVGTSRGRRTPDEAETVTARERVSRRLATGLRLKGPSRCNVCTNNPGLNSTVKIRCGCWRRTGGQRQEE